MNPEYSKQAENYLNKQSPKQLQRIKQAINKLPLGDVKKLKGIENAYRLRVGSVRILFERNNKNIYVVKIDNRGDVYKQ
jgi:mRNA interferase RelE/StbE